MSLSTVTLARLPLTPLHLPLATPRHWKCDMFIRSWINGRRTYEILHHQNVFVHVSVVGLPFPLPPHFNVKGFGGTIRVGVGVMTNCH